MNRNIKQKKNGDISIVVESCNFFVDFPARRIVSHQPASLWNKLEGPFEAI